MSGTATRRPTPKEIKDDVREAVKEVLAEQQVAVLPPPPAPAPEDEEKRVAYNVALNKTKCAIYAALKPLVERIGDSKDFAEMDQAFEDLGPMFEELAKEMQETLQALADGKTPAINSRTFNVEEFRKL